MSSFLNLVSNKQKFIYLKLHNFFFCVKNSGTNIQQSLIYSSVVVVTTGIDSYQRCTARSLQLQYQV